MPEDSPQLLPCTLYLLILRTLAAGPLHGYPIARCARNGEARKPTGRLRFYRLAKEGQQQLAAEASEFNKLVNAIQMVMKTA